MIESEWEIEIRESNVSKEDWRKVRKFLIKNNINYREHRVLSQAKRGEARGKIK